MYGTNLVHMETRKTSTKSKGKVICMERTLCIWKHVGHQQNQRLRSSVWNEPCAYRNTQDINKIKGQGHLYGTNPVHMETRRTSTKSKVKVICMERTLCIWKHVGHQQNQRLRSSVWNEPCAYENTQDINKIKGQGHMYGTNLVHMKTRRTSTKSKGKVICMERTLCIWKHVGHQQNQRARSSVWNEPCAYGNTQDINKIKGQGHMYVSNPVHMETRRTSTKSKVKVICMERTLCMWKHVGHQQNQRLIIYMRGILDIEIYKHINKIRE